MGLAPPILPECAKGRPSCFVVVIVILHALLLGNATTAAAQGVDYGTLQELFGEPITTSATGKPQRQSDVPVTMEIVTAEDIRRSGVTDIPGVLRHLAGIDVWRWSLGNADVAIRGYNQPMQPRILTLINGRQVYLDFYGLTRWSSLPVSLDEIRQIEVVKGPKTVLRRYSPNTAAPFPHVRAYARGGVIRRLSSALSSPSSSVSLISAIRP